MASNSLTLEIGGREAIPIRAIPFITKRRLAPDELASTLAGMGRPERQSLGKLVAYHLVDGKPQPTEPRDWFGVANSLDVLKTHLRAKYPNPDPDDAYDARGVDAWHRESPLMLPKDAFVWRDEFEAAYRADFSDGNLSYPKEGELASKLTDTPMGVDDMRDMVMEGFSVNVPDSTTRGDVGRDCWRSFSLDDDDSPVIDCESFIAKFIRTKYPGDSSLSSDDNDAYRTLKAGELRHHVENAVAGGTLMPRDRGGIPIRKGAPLQRGEAPALMFPSGFDVPPEIAAVHRARIAPFVGLYFERAEFSTFIRDGWLVSSATEVRLWPRPDVRVPAPVSAGFDEIAAPSSAETPERRQVSKEATIKGSGGNVTHWTESVISRNAIKRLFPEISAESWRGIFTREANGLSSCRLPNAGHQVLYDRQKLAAWIGNNRMEVSDEEAKERLCGGSERSGSTASGADFPPWMGGRPAKRT